MEGEKTEVAAGDAPIVEASGGASRLSGLLRKWQVVLRHAPLSVAVFTVVLVLAIVTGTLWRPTHSKSWYHDVAYGVPALADGKWWTPVSGAMFGLTPGQLISILVLIATALAWSEWRLGSVRTLCVLIGAQLVGELGAAAFAWVFGDGGWLAGSWAWADHLARARDVGLTTGIIGAVAAASATLRSPWRLRVRVVLAAYVAVTFLFEGRLADVQHLIAFVVMLAIGERFFSTQEKGLAPRTRREVRSVAFFVLVLIALTDVVVWLFPGSGPLGPTDSGDTNTWALLIHVVIIALVADRLRKGKRWAWVVALVIGVLNVVAVIAALVIVAWTDYTPEGGVTLGTSLLWCIEAVILVSGRFAFQVPRRSKLTSGDNDPNTIKGLLHEHGGGTMSWMTTWEGNQYFVRESADGRGAVSYQKHMGTLIALTDPVCAPADLVPLTHDFIAFADSSGLTPCWFSIGQAAADVVDEHGWRSLQIAEDSIVDLPGLAFKGKHWQDVRTAMNKAKKTGITHRLTHLAAEPFSIRAQVQAISDEWVGDKGLPEMGFTLGGVDECLDPEVRVSLALDADGSVHGVLSWLPVYGPGDVIRGWTLDVMRRRTDGFGPVIEFLLGSAMLEFSREGALFASLSGAPLAHADDAPDPSGADRLLDSLGAAMEPFYGFRSLHNFKKKFNPRYEPVYISYRDEADLPRIGLAISRAYLPQATPAQLVRMATSS